MISKGLWCFGVPPSFGMSRTLPLAVGPSALAKRETEGTVPSDAISDPARSAAVRGAGGDPVEAVSWEAADDSVGGACGDPVSAVAGEALLAAAGEATLEAVGGAELAAAGEATNISASGAGGDPASAAGKALLVAASQALLPAADSAPKDAAGDGAGGAGGNAAENAGAAAEDDAAIGGVWYEPGNAACGAGGGFLGDARRGDVILTTPWPVVAALTLPASAPAGKMKGTGRAAASAGTPGRGAAKAGRGAAKAGRGAKAKSAAAKDSEGTPKVGTPVEEDSLQLRQSTLTQSGATEALKNLPTRDGARGGAASARGSAQRGAASARGGARGGAASARGGGRSRAASAIGGARGAAAAELTVRFVVVHLDHAGVDLLIVHAGWHCWHLLVCWEVSPSHALCRFLTWRQCLHATQAEKSKRGRQAKASDEVSSRNSVRLRD